MSQSLTYPVAPKPTHYIDMDQFAKIYKITAEYLNDLEWIRPHVEKSLIKIMAKFYEFHTSTENLMSFFKDDKMRQAVKSKSSIMTLSFFNGDYSNSFFERNSEVGFIHHKIDLPPFYYEASVEHLKRSIYTTIENEIENDEKFKAIKTISQALDMAKFVTMQSYYYCESRTQEFTKENLKNVLRINCHDVSNHVSILDGIARFLEKDPSRLPKEIDRLKRTAVGIMDSIEDTRNFLKQGEKVSFIDELNDLSPHEMFKLGGDLLHYRLVPSKSYFKLCENRYKDKVVKANFFTFLNHIIVSMVIEINEKTNASSIIYFDLDNSEGVLTGILYSNRLETFDFKRFNLALCIAKICCKKMDIDMRVFEKTVPKEFTVSRKTENYFPLISFGFKNAKDIPMEVAEKNSPHQEIKKEA